MKASTLREHRIGWRLAWRIAGKIAFEVQFRSAIGLSQGAFGQSVERQIEKARSNAWMNKGMVSIFTAILAGIFGIMIWGFSNDFFTTTPELIWIANALTISLFMLMAFGFLLFWGIMVSTSFISTGAVSISLTLPLSRSDVNKVTLLGYLRLFDAQIITIMLAFPLAYFIATSSLLGTLACFASFLVALALSITCMLLLAIYFHTRIQASGGSRLSTLIRILFTLIWAIAIMGFSISFQLVQYLLPVIQIFAQTLQPYWFYLAFLFPFAFGTVVVQATFISGTPFFWSGIIGALVFAFLGIIGLRWGANFLAKVGGQGIIQTGPTIIRPISVRISPISLAVIRKDLRVALRTPGQALMFFLPLLMMFPMFFSLFFETGVIHVMDILILISIPSIMLSFFSIFFLSVETRGMSYTLSLPIKTRTILRAKSQLITLMSLAIPLVVGVISLFRPFTHPVSYFIAISQIPVVYVSSFIALILFTRVIGKGRLIGFEIGQHVSQLVVVGFISGIFTFIPLGLYGLTVLTLNLGLSIPIEFAHWFGLGMLWLGLIFNYLLGQLFARIFIKD
jgi:predicted permease